MTLPRHSGGIGDSTELAAETTIEVIDMSDSSTDRSATGAEASPLRALVEGFPGAAAHITGDSIWLNRLAGEIVGYRASELTTLDEWGNAVHRLDEPQAKAAYVTARAEGFPRPVVLTVYRREGSPRLVEFSAYRGRDEEVWIMRDVTDARRAEQELRDREQRLQVAVATAGLGIWEMDLNAATIASDPATRRLFGVSEQGRSNLLADYLERVLPDDRSRLEEAINTAVENESTLDIELQVRSVQGRARWLRLHGTSVLHGETPQARLVGAVRDIDSYKRMDERLLHAAQMESLGNLAGGVAHDFNNLLAVIRGQVEFVGREPGLSDKAAVRLQSIERAVTKGAEMVASLMQLGQPQAPTTELIDVNKVLEATVVSIERIVGEDVKIELQLKATAPFVRFGEGRLSAVVINLATNARDAMPVGGLLTIATATTPATEQTPDGTEQPWLRLTVEDTGIGMDAETRARIFEPFFTTKAPGLGTGLGLASVYDAVIDAGGVIEVESVPGQGTTFSIDLPCTRSTSRPADTTPTSNQPAPRGQVVMVVEDDATILEITADIIRGAGYRVIEALGPGEAQELVASGQRPDLMLTDVVMPELSGPQLAAKLRQQIPRMPVLYMSGYAPEGRAGTQIDEALLIHKPFSHRQLLDRIADLLPDPSN